MKAKSGAVACALLVWGIVFASSANSFVINFGTDQGVGGFNISQPAQQSIGSDISVDVSDGSIGEIDFTLSSRDTAYDSSVTKIYFGSESLFGANMTFTGFTPSTGVSFSQGANPGDPPPGNQTFSSFSAGSDAPTMHNGVGDNESLIVSFATSLSLTEVENYFTTGEMGIILHVQSIDGGEGGESQWFVNTPPSESYPPVLVSTPATIGLLGLGVLLLVLPRRHKFPN